jgi:predicted phosphodiesterase
MRIAVIADIHGHLTALEAVLADLAGAGTDRVVCLGDVVAGGPQPHEVLARLRELGCPVVMGNTDDAVLYPARMANLDEERIRRWLEIAAWSAARLSLRDLSFVRTFQPTVTLPLGDDATLLCFHGSPRSNTDSIFATTPDAELAQMLEGYSATVLTGGHTHGPFIRPYRQALFVNPGSVGLPYVATMVGEPRPSWAEYGIVEWRAGRLSIELRRVPIDVELVIQAVLQSGMPHATWEAGGWRRQLPR